MRGAAPDAGPVRALRTGSLRRNIVLAVLAVLLAVIVAICASVNVLLSQRLYSDARHQIVDRAQYASVLAAPGLAPQELADGLTGQGITASVLSGGQVTVGRDQPPPGGRPGPRPQGSRQNPPASSVPITVTDQAGQYVVELSVPGGQLRLTSSLVDIHRTLTTLHTVEIAVAIGALLVGALVLVIVVGLMLAPLRRMRTLADRIRAGGRGIRLHPTKPTTDLGRTALALDEMLEALEAAEFDARAAESRMRQLLADVSHDLRTPIAGVITSAEQLLRTDPARETREQRLVELIREGRRAARLVDDLLLMVRLDSGEAPGLPVQTVDAAAVAASAGLTYGRTHSDRVLDVRPDPAGPLWVAIDPDQLTRIMTNLLDNAHQATVHGGHIEISATEDDGEAVLEITDDGPGVPAGAQDRIFDRLVRLDPARRAGGSGLGLPIARALARSAGGDVRYRPNVTKGACFEVRLPIAAVPPPVPSTLELVAVH